MNSSVALAINLYGDRCDRCIRSTQFSISCLWYVYCIYYVMIYRWSQVINFCSLTRWLIGYLSIIKCIIAYHHFINWSWWRWWWLSIASGSYILIWWRNDDDIDSNQQKAVWFDNNQNVGYEYLNYSTLTFSSSF